MEVEEQTGIGAHRVDGVVVLYLRLGGRDLHIHLSDFNANLIIESLKGALAEPVTGNNAQGRLI